jgi:hypothetical protein
MALPPRISGRPGSQPPPEDSLASRRAQDALVDECGKTEEELEALKARYEQYFLGIERREPSRWRDELKRRVERLKESFTKNTGLKFRLQTLHARFLSYERLWLRSGREKEAGTYRRDIFKARLRNKGGEPTPPTEEAEAKAAPPGEADAPAAPAPAPAPQRAAPVRAPAPAAPPTFSGTGEPQLRALYQAFVDAKKRCNEDVSRLTYDALAKSVQKQVPELMTRFKAKAVDFRVEVKDGKAVLKAIPRV